MPPPAPPLCSPLRVLIVEDEALLAMDIESMVEDAGHRVIGEATSLFDVEALPADLAPDIAFVDVQLARDTTGLEVAAFVHRTWPDTVVIFVTANPKKLPYDLAGAAGVIAKPFSRNGLMSAMRYIEEGVCDPPPSVARPASFAPSPAYALRWNS